MLVDGLIIYGRHVLFIRSLLVKGTAILWFINPRWPSAPVLIETVTPQMIGTFLCLTLWICNKGLFCLFPLKWKLVFSQWVCPDPSIRISAYAPLNILISWSDRQVRGHAPGKESSRFELTTKVGVGIFQNL